MRWDNNNENNDYQSNDVEDRRGSGGGNSGGGGFGLGGKSTLGFVLTAGIGILGFMGVLPPWAQQVLNQVVNVATTNNAPSQAQINQNNTGSVQETAEEAHRRQVVSVTLDDSQGFWNQVFADNGMTYQKTKVVLYREATDTGCGVGEAASGPFYCPADQGVYIDLSFYDELARSFQAPGDFAQAYVIAHEVGHHVENLMGILTKAHQIKKRNPAQANQVQVAVELQADCLAGMWAGSVYRGQDPRRPKLEAGDFEEAIRAASSVGDDTIQRRTIGTVDSDSFTHGSAQDRMKWFKIGLDARSLADCDTFR